MCGFPTWWTDAARELHHHPWRAPAELQPVSHTEKHLPQPCLIPHTKIHLCRFNINLIQYASQKCIFHFDARFDQGQSVRNTNYPNNWGPEERSPLNPLQRGRRFALELRMMGDRYLVILSIIIFIIQLSSMLHISSLMVSGLPSLKLVFSVIWIRGY